MKKLISLMTLLATTIGLQGQTTNDRIQLTKAQSHLAKTVPMEIILEKSAIVFRLIPAGKFVMGSPKSEKGRSSIEGQRRMEIKAPFYIGKFEVTQGQWQMIMGANPSSFNKGGLSQDKGGERDTKDFPVENISWLEANAFMCKFRYLRPHDCLEVSYSS